MTSAHPAMTRILDVVARLQEHPYRTNFVLLGEPGTGKEGLGRALTQLVAPEGPVVRFDVTGLGEAEALALLCGQGRRPGLAEQAAGGYWLIEEAMTLSWRLQTVLLRLLKTGRCERVGTATESEDEAETPKGKRLGVNVVAMSDKNLTDEARQGRFRHDLYFRLARIVLALPPLRERPEDITPASLWMGNRLLRAHGLGSELVTPDEMKHLSRDERARAIELSREAVAALKGHDWPGNLRELEAVIERALLLYRRGREVTADDVRHALQNGC